ncbi:MAG: hypothetical protein A2508_04220 [Candidatus Lambdaproteobacteria bacterium RIFOXYD12_FULL_49_8]|uniref:Uncharacterized protein n=1 Tax=Candidatus Lambdaproteobacteria bacterium RIFOXYD2_FULL_50_16 TaxID=1817772 RepID=A0A1F6G9D5_9PROT|nr:MAG: hypothetical protein A2527_05885 [Candidatus Lambdaproteobacteria bacterium RIFOXYD2_FULL_50_16]OGG98115.1 MAG: hypothetical protein A2508_04220 [Candidatus Lambdaproteobacteria bacterium RIFOXYD12_FULL_49_8]
MKLATLKPLFWNDNNYKSPSGHRSNGGFPSKYGYAHEEWNNHPFRIWNGFRVFHSERTKLEKKFSLTGELGLLFIGSNQGFQYLLGVAAGVFHNDEEVIMPEIIKDLHIKDQWEEAWEQDTVKKAFKKNKSNFLKHWETNHIWLTWRCPQEQFIWFDTPKKIIPEQFRNKARLTSHYATHQTLSPDKCIEVLSEHLKSDSPIMQWFANGIFAPESYPKNEVPCSDKSKKIIKKIKTNPSNKTASDSFEYMVEGQRRVEPLHLLLQVKYQNYLKGNGKQPIPDKNYIDLQYQAEDGWRLVEVKPTAKVETKYAIRIAVGQLLEYKFTHFPDKEVILEILLSSKPEEHEEKFVRSLGMRLTYYDEASEDFKFPIP